MSCYKAVVFDFDGTLFDTELHEAQNIGSIG